MALTKNKTLATAVAIFVTAGLTATEQLIEVETFSGVSVGTGMVSKVSCGSNNTVTLKGESKVLDAIVVEINNDVLHVHRAEDAGSLISKLFSSSKSSGYVEVEITTTGELSLIDTSTGATLKVADCAVNTSTLTVDASTGSTVDVSGATAQLTLDLSTGSTFNSRTGQFIVDSAEVDLSTGASANLCGATTVVGDASTGAVIYVGANTDASAVDLSIGAETTSRACK